MSFGRKIVFSAECDAAAEALGGYIRIDCTLDGAMDALMRNPYGFPLLQSDWYSVRYIVTKSMAGVPALVWFFTIEGRDVTIQHVEEYQGY